MKGILGSRDGQVDETPHLLDFLLLNKARGIEMLDLSRDSAIEKRRIKRLNFGDPAADLHQALPRLGCGVSDGGQQTNAGDYDSAGNK